MYDFLTSYKESHFVKLHFGAKKFGSTLLSPIFAQIFRINNQIYDLMKIKTEIIAAAIIAVGIMQLGISLKQGIVKFKEMDRRITVKGLSEREVKADKVTWPLLYKELGNDPSAMYTNMEIKNQKVISFLKAGGITEDEISVNPPTINDRQADNYGNEIMKFRYKATSSIIVTSKNVEKVRNLIRRQTELMKQGIALVSDEYGDKNSIQYEFTGLNKIKPEMVEDATKNARITAQKFAEDADSKLDKIITAQQGQFSIENRDENTPYIKKIRVVSTIEYSLE